MPRGEKSMSEPTTDQFLENNKLFADGEALHKPTHPGPQAIQPSKRVAVVAW